MQFNKVEEVALFEKIQTVAVELGDETANFTVDIGYIEVVGSGLQKIGADGIEDASEASRTVAELLVGFVKEWDLELEPGVPLPLEVEFLSELPLFSLMKWIKIIVQNAQDTENLENRASRRSKKPTSPAKKRTLKSIPASPGPSAG